MLFFAEAWLTRAVLCGSLPQSSDSRTRVCASVSSLPPWFITQCGRVPGGAGGPCICPSCGSVPGPRLPARSWPRSRGWAHEPTELHLPRAGPREPSPPPRPARGKLFAREAGRWATARGLPRAACGLRPLPRLLLQAPRQPASAAARLSVR